jgi:competence protein ComEC
MAERGRGRQRIAAWPAEIAAAGRRLVPWPATFSRSGAWLATVLRRWIAAELAPGRLMPWMAVAFGLGISLYFTAEREPALWAATALALVCAIAAFAARHRPAGFPLLLAAAAIALGFAVATMRTAMVAHPVLAAPAWNVAIAGWVETREQRERSDRIVIRVERIEAARMDPKPQRLRVSVRKGTAPPVGSFVRLKARLTPPLAPLRPGGYDFARDLYFQGLGASGFVLGRIETVASPPPPPLWLRYRTAIGGLRDAIDARIRAVVTGDRGAIASALITGKRDAISAPVNSAMYISGIGHVLSISGYHMAVVAGVMFFFIRGTLALAPVFANQRPIKKWAAAAALAAAAFYLVLSGAEVATQRSFIMVAIVLFGVMLDRPALTFRTITIAALVVLLIAPETLVHPSFQMSFAATLALIAAYQRSLRWPSRIDTSAGARAALWGAREVFGLVLVSLVAGLATMPYAAFHFHRLAPYGLLANLMTMPVFSMWVMPAGLGGVLLMPFGLDAPLWRLMGAGIDWMTAVALWVASLPGAVGHIKAFGIGPLLLGTAGLIALCLLRTPLRLTGVALALIAIVWAAATPRPDILIAADGRAIAVRDGDARLAITRKGSDTFAVRDWLSADGDARGPSDPSISGGIRCDPAGCIGRLADGKLVALSLALEALAEDCRRAAVIATPLEGPSRCAARIFDRAQRRDTGAVALYRDGQDLAVWPARPQGYDRPWSPAYRPPAPRIRPGLRAPMRSPDATPRTDDLKPGD